ncbi:MAG: glycosyltransferase family 2 protein [bacterium]|nr:glycosyltransferase family 2 protein [bacterium]
MSVLISVCVPAYNNAAYLRETIESVLHQTHSNFELILVDDCSTDSTWDVINEFKDPRIKSSRNEKNMGMHGNWSKALSLATGKYIKLICGDDILYPRCLELQALVFENDVQQNVAMVSCRRKLIKADGGEVFGSFYKLRAGNYAGSKAMQYCVTFGTNLIGEPMSVLFRNSVYRDHHIELGSNNYLIDLDLYSKLLKYGNLVVLPDYLAAFRVHSTSMSGSLGLKHAAHINEFYSDPVFGKDHGIKWYHRGPGKILNYSLTLARNVVMFFNK